MSSWESVLVAGRREGEPSESATSTRSGAGDGASSAAIDVTPASAIPRDDALSPCQVAVDVQGEPVHGDAARNSDTDGSDLAFRALLIRRAPDSTATRHLGGDDSKVGTGSDDGFFHPANVCNHVERVGQRHDGVTHELSWAVPGDPTTSVDVDDNGPVGRAIGVLGRRPAVKTSLCSRSSRVGGADPSANRGVDSPLQFPRFGVVDEVVSEAESAAIELFDIGRFQRGGGLGHDTTLLGSCRDEPR